MRGCDRHQHLPHWCGCVGEEKKMSPDLAIRWRPRDTSSEDGRRRRQCRCPLLHRMIDHHHCLQIPKALRDGSVLLPWQRMRRRRSPALVASGEPLPTVPPSSVAFRAPQLCGTAATPPRFAPPPQAPQLRPRLVMQSCRLSPFHVELSKEKNSFRFSIVYSGGCHRHNDGLWRMTFHRRPLTPHHHPPHHCP